MILNRFYDEQLAQASYLIGCGQSGTALVIDPLRAVEQYVAAARAERVRITHVTETHIHADFVSGARELAARTNALLLLSAEGGPDWQYGYGQEPNVRLLHEGDRFQVGNIIVDVMHAPGHTPEHIIFFITDGAAADRPIGVVTGDFVFVGDVGRPDLLERAARVPGSMVQSARTLFRSLQRFKQQPDYLQIWPGHGAGSACGKGLSAIPHSTVGYERMFNWAFSHDNEEAFARAVLTGQPEPPRYFARMKRINRDGPALLAGFAQPPVLDAVGLAGVLEGGGVLIDTRRPDQFARRHIAGTINIPLDDSFSTWAGWLLPYDRPLYLLTDARLPQMAAQAVKALAVIGLDDVRGHVTDAVFDGWAQNGGALAAIGQVQAPALAAELASGPVEVLDVRTRSEWDAGHLAGALHIPLGELPDRLGELPRERRLVVHCQSGTRSAIAASVLRAHGFGNVRNLAGGFGEWQRKGQAVERSEPALEEVP